MSFLLILLPTNKQPKQPTQQMAMTFEQPTKKARIEALNDPVVELKKLNKKERKEKMEKRLAEINLEIQAIQAELAELNLEIQAIQAELAELNLEIQRLNLTHEEKAVWNEKAKTPPTSEDEEA